MINKRNGHITIDPSVVLVANDSLEKFRGIKLGEFQQIRDHKNGWRWLDLWNVRVNSEYFIIQLGFFNDKLKLLLLDVHSHPFDLRNPLGEIDQKQYGLKLREWLTNEIGREGQFLWGYIDVCENKVGENGIFVDFQRTLFSSLIDKVKSLLETN